MAADERREETDPPPETRHPALLELFFDLAFVFVLITLTGELFEQLNWAGAARTLVLLLAFTLIWVQTTWAGDLLSPVVLLPRTIGVMAGVLLMGAAVTDAYGPRGLLFAVTYVAVHLGTGVYMLTVGPARLRVRTLRIFFWSAIAGMGWLAGGMVAGTARTALWAAAIVVEYAAATLGWPAPWSWRRLPRHNQRVVAERVSERYRQFVIIALGVSIYITGNTFTRAHVIEHAPALIVVFMVKVVIWRLYIHRAGELMSATIAGSADPVRHSRLTALVHLIMVVGILGTAVTSKLVISRPFGDTPASWAAVILGGPALFLVGRALFGYIVFARINWALLAGLLLLGGLAPATPLLPPVTLALAVMAILIGAAVSNAIEGRRHPLTPVPRGG